MKPMELKQRMLALIEKEPVPQSPLEIIGLFFKLLDQLHLKIKIKWKEPEYEPQINEYFNVETSPIPSVPTQVLQSHLQHLKDYPCEKCSHRIQSFQKFPLAEFFCDKYQQYLERKNLRIDKFLVSQ
jgi:hypothetical protein